MRKINKILVTIILFSLFASIFSIKTISAETLVGESWDFDFNGDIQSFTIPITGTYKLEVWGGSGGNHYAATDHDHTNGGGSGGYTAGEIQLIANQTIYIVCGGAANGSGGGYNGGGNGGGAHDSWYSAGGGGGGASHISIEQGNVLSQTEQNNVLIVAGGGGGASQNTGGEAGNGSGGAGYGQGSNGGGGTDDNHGEAGNGAGGGGWSGGTGTSSGRGSNYISGKGGTGYAAPSLENINISSGGNNGNGKAKITFIKESIYTVKFVDLYNNELKTEVVKYGESVTPPENYEVEGYDFIEWQPNDFSFIDNDITVQGIYHIKTYPILITTNHGRTILLDKILEHFNTLSYLDKDGNEIDKVTIDENCTNNIEPDILYGYTFKSYEVTNDGEGNYFIKPLYQAKKYKITFLDSNEKMLDTQYIEYLNDADPPTAPQIHGFTFAGWDNAYTNVTEDRVLTALYNEDDTIPRWAVTFTIDAGDVEYANFNINNEAKYSYTEPRVIDTTKLESILPIYALSKSCKFSGWYIDDIKVSPSSYKVTGITNVVAKFYSDINFNNIDDETEFVTVTFDTQGGTEITPKQVTLNSKLSSLESPSKEGYEFDGWYLSSSGYSAFDFTSRITKDTTLYAKWIDLNADKDLMITPKIVSNEIIDDPVIKELVPDFSNMYCNIHFISTNDDSNFYINVIRGTRFYVLNSKNQKIREYQIRQSCDILLPTITIEENQKVNWKVTWSTDEWAYYIIPSIN